MGHQVLTLFPHWQLILPALPLGPEAASIVSTLVLNLSPALWHPCSSDLKAEGQQLDLGSQESW